MWLWFSGLLSPDTTGPGFQIRAAQSNHYSHLTYLLSNLQSVKIAVNFRFFKLPRVVSLFNDFFLSEVALKVSDL